MRKKKLRNKKIYYLKFKNIKSKYIYIYLYIYHT